MGGLQARIERATHLCHTENAVNSLQLGVLSEVLHLTCDSLKILLLTAALIEEESNDSITPEAARWL